MNAALLTPLPIPPLPRQRILLKAAPALDPPYDEPSAVRTTEPASLRLVPPLGAIELPFDDSLPPGRILPADPTFDPQPTSRANLPCPRRTAAALLRALLEVLAGRRPVHQLMPVTTDQVYVELQKRLRRRSPGELPALRSIRVGEPADGIAEISAVIRQGERHRAVAVRLEGIDGRWRCTALQLG